VTSPAFAMEPLGRVLLYAGLVGYAVALLLVVYRLAKVGDLPGPALPSIAILVAPPSLCLAGYLAVAETKQPVVVYVLLAAAAVSLLYVLARLPQVLTSTFHPGFAALTFPFVITALAVKLSAGYLAKSGAGVAIPPFAVQAFELAALAVVLYVLARYVVLLAVPAKD
jgi:exfoliative toxin A/B